MEFGGLSSAVWDSGRAMPSLSPKQPTETSNQWQNPTYEVSTLWGQVKVTCSGFGGSVKKQFPQPHPHSRIPSLFKMGRAPVGSKPSEGASRKVGCVTPCAPYFVFGRAAGNGVPALPSPKPRSPGVSPHQSYFYNSCRALRRLAH
jgi:hypothetical protein